MSRIRRLGGPPALPPRLDPDAWPRFTIVHLEAPPSLTLARLRAHPLP